MYSPNPHTVSSSSIFEPYLLNSLKQIFINFAACQEHLIRQKIMTVLALILVVSSVAAAGGAWTPPTAESDDVIVKESRRVIVVEYDEHGKRNTKVSISTPSLQQQTKPGDDYFDKETMKEAASELPNLGYGVSQGKADRGRHAPGELICDAFGECTHKIATALGKAKDKVSDTAHEAKDKVSETPHQTKGAVADALGKAKEAVVQKGQDVKERAKYSIDKAKDTAKTTTDRAKTIGDHIVRNVTEQVENVREKAMEEAKETKEKTERAANKFFDGFKYMTSVEAMNSVMAMANLLGLATAYGMSVWVTFISSYVLAGQLPRQQFGVVQSKIYPVYFRAMAYSIGLALLGHILGQRKRLMSSKPEMFQAFNLFSSLFMVLVNALYLEPKATKVMFERMKMEKEEGRGRHEFVAEGSRVANEPPSVTDSEATTKSRQGRPSTPAPTTSSEREVMMSRMVRLNERLKKLNTNSSLLNILILMALTWHLVYLGQRQTLNC